MLSKNSGEIRRKNHYIGTSVKRIILSAHSVKHDLELLGLLWNNCPNVMYAISDKNSSYKANASLLYTDRGSLCPNACIRQIGRSW